MTFRLPAVVLLFGALYGIQSHIDRSLGPYRATEEILYVDRGDAMKRMLLGFDNVAADLYWLRTVQYFGGKRLDATNKDYRLLEPLLNITIELDPNFKIAYSYGATFLSEPFPAGAGQPEKGIEIIDKAIERHPEHWRFYLDKGFIYFWFLHDYEKAAEVFLAGSELPGAPYWMIATATRTLTLGGDRETARYLWQMLYQSAETSQQQDNATIHLQQLDALDEMDLLGKVVENFQLRAGRYPAGWQELVDTGFLEQIPVDPAGTAYALNSETHAVEIGSSSPLGGLPRE